MFFIKFFYWGAITCCVHVEFSISIYYINWEIYNFKLKEYGIHLILIQSLGGCLILFL